MSRRDRRYPTHPHHRPEAPRLEGLERIRRPAARWTVAPPARRSGRTPRPPAPSTRGATGSTVRTHPSATRTVDSRRHLFGGARGSRGRGHGAAGPHARGELRRSLGRRGRGCGTAAVQGTPKGDRSGRGPPLPLRHVPAFGGHRPDVGLITSDASCAVAARLGGLSPIGRLDRRVSERSRDGRRNVSLRAVRAAVSS
jgi:hypothetical protein